MCGIIFTISKPTHHKGFDDFMTNGLIASQVRGVDSTGIFRVSHAPAGSAKPARGVFMEKQACDATTFLNRANCASMVKAASHSALAVGHVRHRTHGAVSQSNAHPFQVMRTDMSEITGVHNGSLTNWKTLKEGNDYAVDSEWLYNMIADDGIKAFKGFDGAYALVWYDTATPNIVNIARNDKRPLYFAWTKNDKGEKDGIVGCSELGMLGWMADRSGLDIWEDGKGKKYFYFSPDKLFQISLQDMEITEVIDLPKYSWADNPYKIAFTYNHPSSHVRTTGYYSDPYSHRHDQQHVVSVVERIMREQKEFRTNPKPALKQLSLIEKTDEIITNDDLVDGSDVRMAADDELTFLDIQPGSRFLFADGMSASSATQEEVKTARQLGVFGMVGRAVGWFLDEDTNELNCSFSVGLETKKDISDYPHYALLRFVTTSQYGDGGVYSDKNIDKAKFAVIGVRRQVDTKNSPYPLLILTPITKHHRLVNRRASLVVSEQRKTATLH